MKSFIFKSLFTFARMILSPYLESGFFPRVEQLVSSLLDEDMPGEEKHKKVVEWIEAEYNQVHSIITNLVIELSVAKLINPDLHKSPAAEG